MAGSVITVSARVAAQPDLTWDVEEPFPAVYTKGPFPGFWGEWQSGLWEPDTIATLDRFVRPGSTFLDLGACIGAHSLGALARGAHVIAIEPDPIAFSYLVANCERNYRDRLWAVRAAVSTCDGTSVLTHHPAGWGSSMSSLVRFDPQPDSVTVDCFTVQRLFADYAIDDCCLVKMDIEGTEVEILESVAPFLAQRGIPLRLSTHEDYWGGRRIDPAWFSGFSRVEGPLDGMEEATAIP